VPRTNLQALGIAAVAVAALASPMTAAARTPSPDLRAMALRPADFPYGATITAQEGKQLYSEDLRAGDRAAGRRTQDFVEQALQAFDSADEAGTDVDTTQLLLSTSFGRKLIAREIVKGAGLRSGIRVKDVKFQGVRDLKLGDTAFELRFTVPKAHVAAVMVDLSVGRVETGVVLVGPPRSRLRGRLGSLMRSAVRRIRAGLVPKSTAPPVVSGVPGAGRLLTASSGSWDPVTPPSAFAYQWQRCGAAGCTPIPGATSPSYAVAAADIGAALRVAVVASNDVGSAVVVSAPTALIA
jgi:hypothetical protein